MKQPERVAELLAELRAFAETDFERHRIDVLERDLTAPPVVEVIDDKHQRFNGVTYRKAINNHYYTAQGIYRDVWLYHNGEIPDGYQIHHVDCNPANNAIENLQCLTPAEHRKIHNGKPIIEKTCPCCGKNFTVSSNHSGTVCCSRSCAAKIQSHVRKNKKSPEEKTCPICLQLFTPKKSKQICCSRACAAKFNGRRNKKPPVRKICPVCGKEFTLKHPSDKQIYCSQSCANTINGHSKKF